MSKLMKFPALFSRNYGDMDKWLADLNTVWLDAERAFDDFDRQFPLGVRNMNFPPRNIVKTETGYDIDFAVAGFKREDLTVEVDTFNVLTITGQVKNEGNLRARDGEAYLVRGIAARQFVNKLQLLPDDEVDTVKLADGILSIKVKSVPFTQQPTTKFDIQ